MIGTIFVSVILICAVTFAIITLIKNKKNGKSSCGGTCGGTCTSCPLANNCSTQHIQK